MLMLAVPRTIHILWVFMAKDESLNICKFEVLFVGLLPSCFSRNKLSLMWLLDHLAKDWVLPAVWLILGNTLTKPGILFPTCLNCIKLNE